MKTPLKIAGIYHIRCQVTDRKYIGHTTDYLERKRKHMSQLAAGTHHNKELQAEYDLYGEEVVFPALIRICDEKDLKRYEAEAIRKVGTIYARSGYNKTIPGSYAEEPFAEDINLPDIKWKPIIEIDVLNGTSRRFATSREVRGIYNIPYKRLQEILSYWKQGAPHGNYTRKSWQGKIFIYEEFYDSAFDYITHARTTQRRLDATQRHLKIKQARNTKRN